VTNRGDLPKYLGPSRVLTALFFCVLTGFFSSGTASESEWEGIVPDGFTAFELENLSKGDFLRVLRKFEMEVEALEFANNILFLKFREPEARDRAIRLHQRLDIPPQRVGLHLYLISATDRVGEGRHIPVVIQERLSAAFSFTSYAVVDQIFITVNTNDKAESYLAGRYKVTLKPKKANEGAIKLSGITVRDIDLDFVLQKRSNVEANDPDPLSKGADGLRKSDTRLIKTSVTVESGETIVAGSWDIGEASLITVITTQILK
jgi:hypothetical protein